MLSFLRHSPSRSLVSLLRLNSLSTRQPNSRQRISQRSGRQVGQQLGQRGVLALLGAIALWGTPATTLNPIIRPATAAEQINLRVGPLRQTIYVSDLALFAESGVVPDRLKLYQTVLTPDVRAVLNNRLALDPAIGERMVEDVLASPNGELLLDALGTVVPGLTVEQIQTAVHTAAADTAGLNVLGVLQAIPQESLDIDLTAAVGMVSQLNLSRLEGQALSSVLAHGLLVANPPALPDTMDPAQAGPQPVGQRHFSFYDADRQRKIALDVYRGVYDKDAPLVVLSHGFGADRQFLTYMAEHLASHGLTVVSIEHPGSNVEALTQTPLDPNVLQRPGRLLPATEFIDRPLDVTFVLDRLEWMNRSSTVLRRRPINTETAVVIGHSLGGYTGLALAGATLDLQSLRTFCEGLQPVGLSPADWLQCAAVELSENTADFTDDRIISVMAMNPLVGELFGPEGLSQVTVPTLILTGTQDGVTPTLRQQLTPFTQLAGPKYLVAVIGGTHLSVGDPDNVNQSLTQVPFMPELQGEQTVALREYLQGTSLSFVMQHTDEAERYQPFLSSTYAQQFSTEALPLRFTQTLPDSVLSWMRLTDRDPTRVGWGRAFSWLHLETLESQDRLYRFQQQMTAYMALEQLSITMLRWPFPSLRLF
ncbi:MAG: alpha/beta fold hydrolase [Cyanobacteria bacterium J06632_22]